MSNILDGELQRRKPTERSHGEVIGAAVVDSELLCEVVQRIKEVAGVKSFLVLPVASLHLSVMAWRVGPNELVPDAQFFRSGLK